MNSLLTAGVMLQIGALLLAVYRTGRKPGGAGVYLLGVLAVTAFLEGVFLVVSLLGLLPPAGQALLPGLAVSSVALGIVGALGVMTLISGASGQPLPAGYISRLYAQLTEYSPDLIVRHDDRGNLIYISPSCEERLGYRQADMVGRSMYEFIHPEDAPRVRTMHKMLLGGAEGGRSVTYRFRAADGTYLWLETQSSLLRDPHTGEIDEIFCISRDISKRMESERRLEENRALLRMVFDTSPDLIYVKDPDNRFVLVNKAVCDAIGKTEEEILGKREDEVLPEPTEAARYWPDDRRVIDEGTTLQLGESEFTFADGKRHWMRRTKSPLVGASGRVERVLPVAVDVPELKDVIDAGQRTRSAAEDTSRAKSEFLAVMSHEIRTPLNSIIGFSELFLEDPGDEGREYVEIINSNSRHLLRLINSILDYSKLEAGHVDLEEEPFEVDPMLTQVGEMFMGQVQQREIEIEIDSDPEIPDTLTGDQQKIQQVLINLVSNAVKHTHAGKVSLSAVQESNDGKTAHVQFSVTDTGAGIAEDQLQRIFDPFAQIRAKKKNKEAGGTGLGLSISRKLVRAMGGDLRAESVPGEGSRFYFSIPLALPEANQLNLIEDDAGKGTRGGGQRTNPLRVLIVDDEPFSARLATSMAERLGCRSRSAATGEQALKQMQEEAFDLVLLDLSMPGMDGFEVAGKIRELYKEGGAPFIVALTAATDKEDRQKCLDAGMNFFLSKPVSMEVFRSCLDTVRTLHSSRS